LSMNKFSIVAVAVAACGITFAANAATVSHQSNKSAAPNDYIEVGGLAQDSTGFHGGLKGDPAIGISTVSNAQLIGLSGLRGLVAQDGNGVTVISAPSSAGAHNGMGVFNFTKVADKEVYFGEWSATGTATDTTHTAWYSGKDASTSVPTGGTASYTVAGISQYTGSNKLNGTLNADFGAKTLKGNITNSSLTVGIDATIANNASFAGTASANGVNGTSKGQFYGSNVDSLAGVATFTDHSKDTAFGGSKN
ncbi:TPA: Slam-dependent surface lipoprotein, partial [Klebsiella pneumoniae]|uniref:Slam-dependent surface lipoprotein n=2 Tax=Klebsiella pneumoniae TaxID=573 RepID=UPI0026585AC9